MDENTLMWIKLTTIFGSDSARLWELYDRFECAENIFRYITKPNPTNILPAEIREACSVDMDNYAKDIATFCYKNAVKIITVENTKYPERLYNIPCPPFILYCIGDTQCLLNDKAAAIVGARKASDYSIKTARVYANHLAANNAVTVSGCAKGVDSAAHWGALESGGKTIAVLGCGVLYNYPPNQSELKTKISENGLIISEYPPLKEPEPLLFKIRNRIIAGLSQNILVVQAGKRSGALNTAFHGLEQGKDIYVIPPRDIFDNNYAGQITLLKDGAIPSYSPDDILNGFL